MNLSREDAIALAKEAGFDFNKYGRLQADEDREIDADDILERLCNLAIAKSRLAEGEQEPDMFWNADDSEKAYESISEFLNDELCNGNPLEVGDTRTVMQAKRLPNIEIRITAVDDNECEADWEVIAAPQGAPK